MTVPKSVNQHPWLKADFGPQVVTSIKKKPKHTYNVQVLNLTSLNKPHFDIFFRLNEKHPKFPLPQRCQKMLKIEKLSKIFIDEEE